MYTTVNLTKTEHNREITRDTYAKFFYNYQLGVLLSLKEDGFLTEMQYRNAEQILTKQAKAEGECN